MLIHKLSIFKLKRFILYSFLTHKHTQPFNLVYDTKLIYFYLFFLFHSSSQFWRNFLGFSTNFCIVQFNGWKSIIYYYYHKYEFSIIVIEYEMVKMNLRFFFIHRWAWNLNRFHRSIQFDWGLSAYWISFVMNHEKHFLCKQDFTTRTRYINRILTFLRFHF